MTNSPKISKVTRKIGKECGMGLTPPRKPGSQKQEDARQKRLAQALRANLLKRKQQARLREELLGSEKGKKKEE